MQLLETDEPQVLTKNVQHTPKPAAQLPSTEPPLFVHSVDEKHVPYTVRDEVEDEPVH